MKMSVDKKESQLPQVCSDSFLCKFLNLNLTMMLQYSIFIVSSNCISIIKAKLTMLQKKYCNAFGNF